LLAYLVKVHLNLINPMLIFTFYLVPNPKIILELLNKLLAKNFDGVNSAYNMFKYSVRSELARKYYERRINEKVF